MIPRARKATFQQIRHMARMSEIWNGAICLHRRRGSLVIRGSQYLQMMDWLADRKHPERAGAFGVDCNDRAQVRALAMGLAGFTHASMTVYDRDQGVCGVAEMTSPRARVRSWRQLQGETVAILYPAVCPVVRALAMGSMLAIGQLGHRYPYRELVLHSSRIGKWLRKALGGARFAALFDHTDADVCARTVATALVNAENDSMRTTGEPAEHSGFVDRLEALAPGALTPAMLACFPAEAPIVMVFAIV